jgi:hypothetical protein
VKNRARLLVEVVEAVTAAWEPGRVGVRFSPTSPFNSMSDADPVATFGYAAAALDGFGLAYLHAIEAVAGPAVVPGAPLVAPELRRRFRGPLILNGGYEGASAEAAVSSGAADLIAFGVPFISNPDLVERLASGAPLAPADRATFYGGDEQGYTDYPTRDGVVEQPEAAARCSAAPAPGSGRRAPRRAPRPGLRGGARGRRGTEPPPPGATTRATRYPPAPRCPWSPRSRAATSRPLAALGATMAVGLAFVTAETNRERHAAHVLNVAGRQRMMSQSLALAAASAAAAPAGPERDRWLASCAPTRRS